MEEKEPLQNQEEEREGWTPASFEKRAAAWMGIAYVLMVLFVINFAISVALAVVVVHRMRNGTIAGGTAGGVAVLAMCAVGLVAGLLLGVPALLAALGV